MNKKIVSFFIVAVMLGYSSLGFAGCASACGNFPSPDSCNGITESIGNPVYTVTCEWDSSTESCGVETCGCTSGC